MIVGGCHGAHEKLPSDFTNMANLIFNNPRTANYCKVEKNRFPSKHVCKSNTLLHISAQLIALQIRYPRHTLLTEERILTLFSYPRHFYFS